MPNYKFISPSYEPSEANLRSFLEVLEWLRHKSVAGMLDNDPDTFPDENEAIQFLLDVGDRYISDMEDDLCEATETEEAAVATMHALTTGFAFAVLANNFPVVRDWL